MYHPLPPVRVAIANMKADQVNLYCQVPSLGQPIPVGVYPLLMEYSILEDKEISWAVRRLFLNRLGGPSVMQTEQLYQWLHKAMQDGMPDTTN